jgi:hypothetical protein
MKPTDARPADHVMKFFTRDLFLRFNSPDDEVADRADEEWETAIQDYRKHLEILTESMPGPSKKLAELCLHDAVFLGIRKETGCLWPFFDHPSEFAWMTSVDVKQRDTVYTLSYVASVPVLKRHVSDDWPFSRAHLHWLYDELDVSPDTPNEYVHRVLLSDGSVLVISFASVLVHEINLKGNA